ncbi:MAG TPA: hypothetical protein VMS98_09645 [Thermoanaerobaculia bacterium]|nr:hypothetical protein [Thermoanaerobaculia bacterium]
MDRFGENHYLLRRKLFSFIHTGFTIFNAAGAPLLYGRKKGFKLKEDIRLYEDEGLSREVLSIQARSVIDFSASYDVTDRSGTRLGVLRRKGFRSLLRDEWQILGPTEQPIAVIQEDSQMMALLRRFLSNLIPQTFHILAGTSPIAEIKQNFNPFLLKLNLDFSLDTRKQLDRRLGLAAAALLCTVEGRQG